MQPRYLKMAPACQYSGTSRSKMYLLIGEGKIAAKKDGKTILIDRESLDRHQDSLPAALIAAPKRAA